MSKHRGSFQSAIEHNEQFPCAVEGCTENRKAVGKYCRKHRRTNAEYGHPLMHKLRNSRHAVERHQVLEIVENNSSHPGLLQAIQWIDQWIECAVTGVKVSNIHGAIVGTEELRWLYDNNVTATDILVESAAFWLFMQNNKHLFYNDAASDIALSLAVLTMVPRDTKTTFVSGVKRTYPKRYTAKARRDIGKRLRVHLLPLYLNLQSTIEANRNAVLSTREAMQAPLAFPAKLTPMKGINHAT